MNERIKEIREYYSLSQKEFGERIELKQNSVAVVERGKRNLSERSINLICKEFSINKTWLLTGEGDMFKGLTPSEEIESFLSTLAITGDENFKKRLILYLAQMKDSDWEKLEQVLDTLLAGKDIIFPPDTNNKQN
jgi:transcriptional regulator with XRE-family HTH domain